MKTKSIIMRSIVTAVVLFIICNTFFRSGNEYKTALNFKISKIRVAPTGVLILYDMEGNEISFWNYGIMDTEGVIVGDSVSKGACAEKLHIFKKNAKGKYELYLTLIPTSIVPLSWFCN